MITTQDERKGLIKTTWKRVRQRVAKVEPQFAKLVDILDPDQSFPLYLAYYPYGAVDADVVSTLFPNIDGSFFRLSDPNVPKELMDDLGYSVNNTPLSMVLEKQIECFIDLKFNEVTIPSIIYTPGKIFPLDRMSNCNTKRIYAPYRLLCSTAGARSAFMLANIGCATNHVFLQREFHIKTPPPKSLYDHWFLFKELASNKNINSDWRCCVLYFSKKWIDKLENNKNWSELKLYLHNLAWQRCEYEMNRINYDMIFSIIQQKRNLKPNPYLVDTAKHLFTIGLGAAPGYIPAINCDALPTDILQKIFMDFYGLKYTPTVLNPVHYNFEEDKTPIYYSLQNPSTFVFSPKSRNIANTLQELRELEHLTNIFNQELSKDEGMCASDTVMNNIAKKIKFSFFHNKTDSHRIVQHSSHIALKDSRFNYFAHQNNSSELFACDGPFARGCISIHT